jgi:hypothetical protein
VNTVLPLGALVIALASAYFAWRADRRSTRAERRATESAKESRQAILRWKPAGWGTHGDGRNRYDLLVRNAGMAAATDVVLSIVDNDGNQISETAVATSIVDPDEGWVNISADIWLERVTPELRFALDWSDRSGDHHVVTDLGLPT